MRNDAELLDHILNHIDNGTTDLGNEEWLEPVENYASQARFDAERRLMRRLPIPLLPSCRTAGARFLHCSSVCWGAHCRGSRRAGNHPRIS